MRYRNRLHYIESFTAGVLLAVCFFDIVPEAFEQAASSPGGSPTPMLVALVTGFLVFHVLEKAILIHHSHETQYADHKHPSVGLLALSVCPSTAFWMASASESDSTSVRLLAF